MRHVFRRASIAAALAIGMSMAAVVSARQGAARTPPAQGTAKPAPANPITDSIKSTYVMAKGYVTMSAQQMIEKDYAFKPAGVAAEVRSFGQLIGHIANANYLLCGPAAGSPMPAERGPGGADYEKTTAKADLQKALAASFVFCDKAFALTNDRNGAQPVTGLPIGDSTRLGSLAFENAHLMEHYGNIVTYMRAKGLVPPSSQGGH